MKSFQIGPYLFFTLLFFISCNQTPDSTAFANCKSGTPEAIFNSNLEGIASHHFKLEASRAIETLTYQNNEVVRIIQTGCDHVKQDFQFQLSQDPGSQETSFWIDLCIEKLLAMSKWGDQYQIFGAWAQAIDAKRQDIKLAESTALQPGAFVKIDRISGSGNAILMLTLSEKS